MGDSCPPSRPSPLAPPRAACRCVGLLLTYGYHVTYDVSADGQRFVVVDQVEESSNIIRVTQNWYEEFRDARRTKSRERITNTALLFA